MTTVTPLQRFTGNDEEETVAVRNAETPCPKQPSDSRSSRAAQLEEYDHQVAKRLSETPSPIVRRAEALLADPQLVDLVLDAVRAVGVVGEVVLALTLYMAGVSRLLMNPLAVIVQGTTSSGKSFAINAVSRLFPHESLLVATSLTPNALFYLPRGRLLHRWVVAGERSRIKDDVHAEATRALREMIASGELRKAVPERRGNRMETIVIHQHGPIAYSESTTSPDLDDEDANRCFLITTDESAEQTRRVVSAIATGALESRDDVPEILAIHHAAQRMLKRVRVVVPFAERLAEAMPCDRPEARRAINHVLSMIRAVAVLHQRQRGGAELEHGDTIEAAIDDYVVARRLLLHPLGRSLGGALPDAVARFGQRLNEHSPAGAQFTSTEAMLDDPILSSKSKVNDYLNCLETAGCAEVVEPHHGSKPAVWQMTGEIPDAGARWLPSLHDLNGDDDDR